MDVNPLTPNKIQRLIHLAEDRSFNSIPRRLLLNDEDLKRLASNPVSQDKSATNTNSSSGILDLERVEGFGESVLGNLSLSKSTAFNPGEMTGRSTGAEDIKPTLLSTTQTLSGQEQYGRHSIALDSITSEMDRQTTEVNDLLRHSIATDFSFHSKRDLTADESSFIKREAPLPVPTSQQMNFADSMMSSNTSVGAYFQHRCPEFGKILGKTDSPDRSYAPSISEVSTSISYQIDPVGHSTHYKMDQTLDSVPVKQSRIPATIPEKNIVNTMNNKKTLEKKTFDTKRDIQNLFSGKLEKQDNTKANKDNEKPMMPMHYNAVNHKSMMNVSVVPSDIMLRHLEHSMRMVQEDTEGEENSLSISKIQDFLGRQSGTNVSVSDMLKLNKKKKQPLSELQMNIQESKQINENHVTLLKDAKSMATASTAGSINTVISVGNVKAKIDLPAVFVTADTLNFNEIKNALEDDVKEKPRSVKSRSPSSNSQSTLSTVQDNFASFKSSDSPLHTSRGDAHIPSPNTEYKELDKSVNWHELLRHRHLKQSIAKEQWADISVTAAKGYVGVSCPVTITTTILTDTWLTAKFQFNDLPDDGKNLTVELPRFPLLLSPGKSEQFTLYITSNVEMNTTLPFTMFFKDASIDLDVMQKGNIIIDVKMPIIQAMSSDGVNKVTFPPIQEKTVLTKAFVLISDCDVDLQLELSVVEGDSLFVIKNVQEIKKGDVNKVLMDRQGSTEDSQAKGKNKNMNKQLCRLTSGNAIRVTVTFKAPKLSDIQLPDALSTFNGALNVNLYGMSTTLRKVDLIGTVGSVNLVIQTGVPGTKLELTNEPTKVTLCNTGTIQGMWFSKIAMTTTTGSKIPFKISPSKFDIRPGGTRVVTLAYAGPDDCVTEAILAFEDVASGNKTKLEICGGSDKIKIFPIKTNHNMISWVRSGRKELSMRNSLDKKIQIRCYISGEGFSIDLPGGEHKGTYVVSFTANECRPLPLLFSPNSCTPQYATLHLVHDKNNEFSRAIRLYGCASGEPLRWSGLVTYGDTALVRAAPRRPLDLALYNKANAKAFVCARVHFNLQFMFASESSRLEGGRRVVSPRSKHVVKLHLEWGRVERRARDCPGSALATVTVLTGAELTRRRILKVLRNESGEVDTSFLPAHLRELADQYEGEDPSMDEQLALFNETKSSLSELLGGLHELTAQIDLPQDYADENTIVISDDTLLEHHTLHD